MDVCVFLCFSFPHICIDLFLSVCNSNCAIIDDFLKFEGHMLSQALNRAMPQNRN